MKCIRNDACRYEYGGTVWDLPVLPVMQLMKMNC